MPYVTREQITQAKQIDLLTYLQHSSPEQLVQLSGGTYCTREHDSLKISNGKWHWFSRGFGGRTALDYLIKVENYPFTHAVETILGRAAAMPPVSHTSPAPKEKKELVLPERNDNNDTVIKYITSRGIDRSIIEHCISRGLLYESKQYHNAVFVGHDSRGAPRYAALRGTLGDFKGEAPGSDKRYSFMLSDNPSSERVHLFDCAIDALSYATLLKRSGISWQDNPLLSFAGVYKAKEKADVPMALERFLDEHKSIGTLYLHLDNDEVGRGASACIAEVLGSRYRVVDVPVPYGKDVNEYLLRRQELTQRREEWSR